MGVMECRRDLCPHVMCSRLILDGRAYLCEDCYQELLKDKESWPPRMTKLEVADRIRAFLKTPPGNQTMLEAKEVDDEFHRLTGDRDDG